MARLGYSDAASNRAGVDGSGFLGAIHGGYRWDIGQFVFGTEPDCDTLDVNLGRDVGSLDDVTRVNLIDGADLGSSRRCTTTGAAYGTATDAGASLSDDGWFYGAGRTNAINGQWTIGANGCSTISITSTDRTSISTC